MFAEATLQQRNYITLPTCITPHTLVLVGIAARAPLVQICYDLLKSKKSDDLLDVTRTERE